MVKNNALWKGVKYKHFPFQRIFWMLFYTKDGDDVHNNDDADGDYM